MGYVTSPYIFVLIFWEKEACWVILREEGLVY